MMKPIALPPRTRFGRWWAYRFNPDLQDWSTAYNPALGIMTAAGVSAVVVALLSHLTVINAFGIMQTLMQTLGRLLIPGSQGITPAQGYLGATAGIFSSYFLVFLVSWLAGFQMPFVTIDRLPWFLVIVYALHAVLAWQLFFPWLPI